MRNHTQKMVTFFVRVSMNSSFPFSTRKNVGKNMALTMLICFVYFLIFISDSSNLLCFFCSCCWTSVQTCNDPVEWRAFFGRVRCHWRPPVVPNIYSFGASTTLQWICIRGIRSSSHRDDDGVNDIRIQRFFFFAWTFNFIIFHYLPSISVQRFYSKLKLFFYVYRVRFVLSTQFRSHFNSTVTTNE